MKDFNIKNNLAGSMEHLTKEQLEITMTQTKYNILIPPPNSNIGYLFGYPWIIRSIARKRGLVNHQKHEIFVF
jgi:hypothetical protein